MQDDEAQPNQYINNDTSFYPPQDGQTDASRYMLNVTSISNNQFIQPDSAHEPLRFNELKDNLLDTQALNRKKQNKDDKKQSVVSIQQPQNHEYLSQHMIDLKICLETDDDKKFEDIVRKEMFDSEEILMYLFGAVSCFNSEKVFDILLKRNNYFQVNREWHQIFSSNRIFYQLSGFSSSIERRKFDQIALKIAIERDFFFMTELILDRSIMTKELIQILLQENQKKLLVQQISKAKRPIYLDVDQYNLNNKHQKYSEDVERELHFNDIIYAALDKKEPSKSIIDLIKLMKNEIQSQFFEDADKEFNLKDLFRIFVQRRKIKLLRFLFSLHNEFDFSPQLFIESLELEAFDIGALLYKEFFRRLKDAKKENEYIITILISSLNKNNGQLDFKAYLLRSYLDQFILRHAKQFLDTLDSKVQQENKFNVLVMNLNVVKSACLLIEVLEMMGDRFERLKVRCKTLRHKIEQITKKYMMEVDTEQEMRYLLLEKDFENRDALELITIYNIFPMLESQYAENVVREIWRSPYATNNSLFSASTNHKLTFYYFHCIKDDEVTNRFYQPKDIRTFEAHPLQFTVWRFSGKSRIIIDFFATGILAAIIHIFVNFLLLESPNINDTMKDFLDLENRVKSYSNKSSPDYLKLEASYRQSYKSMSNEAEDFFNKVLIVSYLSFLPLLFAFQHMFNIVYASINKRMVDPYAFMNLLDLLIFGVYLTNILITYVRNLSGTWQDYPLIGIETRAVIYCRNYYGSMVSEDALWICCIVILWIRVFYFLRFNEFMGRFVGIIERLLYDVVLFFCFYLLELVFFALIAEICFRRLTDYNTWSQAFKTLFYASMGQFSFDDMQQADYGEYFGITYMIIFLVCNIGLVMNLFIAVITVLYDAYAEQSNIYQMLETLKLRSYTQADKEYSALVSLPAPLNIVLVIFAPILLTSRNPKRLNEFLLSIAYLPVMFGVTLLFIIYNIALLPATYVKLFFHKLVMIYVYSKSYRVSRADKFITFVIFIWFGPFILILNAVVDIWYFLKHLWLKDLFKTKHKTSEKLLKKETLDKINQYFKKKSEKILPYKQIAVDIRDQLDIIQQVSGILRPKSLMNLTLSKNDERLSLNNKSVKPINQHSLDQLFTHVSEYTIIKQIMERNSEFIRLDENNQRIKTVDCKILNAMISDIYRFKTALKIEEDEFIFIRRAISAKKDSQNDKKKKVLESDNPEQHLIAQIDSEQSKESLKRQKQLFKKLLFLNSSRMLQILDYKTGEVERKKLVHALKLGKNSGEENNILGQIASKSSMFRRSDSQGLDLDELEEKIFEMGSINPQLGNSLSQMRNEIQNLIQFLSNMQQQQQQVSEKEKNYQSKINGLIQDLQNLKDEKENVKHRTQNVIEDYFYDNKKRQSMKQQKNLHSEEEKLQEKNEGLQSEKKFQEVKEPLQPSKQQKIGQPSPQKEKRMETESDIPDVEDDED